MQPHSTRVCLAPCSTLFVRRVFIGAASSGQSFLPSPPIILLMDTWAPSSWGCYGGCHNQVLDCVFWLTDVFVRCLPRNGIGGLLFSRCYELVLRSVCPRGVCELWLLQVLGMVSLAHCSSDPAGCAGCSVGIFVFLTPAEVKTLVTYLLTIWANFLVICLFKIFPLGFLSFSS